MCLALYISSDTPLRLIPWNGKANAFHVMDLQEDQKSVCQHFSKQHVYFVGGKEKCSCAFKEAKWRPEDYPEAMEDFRKLMIYLKENPVREIYCCDFGDEGKPSKKIRTVSIEQMESKEFIFQEQELLKVS